MDVQIENLADHVRVVAKGEYDPATAHRGILDILEACRASGLNRVLIDGRAITTTVSVMHRYDFATKLADAAATRLRMAIVVSHENMFSKTLENTALNLGVDVRTTDSIAEALAYLGLWEA